MIFKQKGKDDFYKIWHTIDTDMTLLYVHNGLGSIVTGERVYPMKDGALCFIGSKKSHYTMPDVPDNYIRTKLSVSVEKFYNFLSAFKGCSQFENFSADAFVYAEIPIQTRAEVEEIFENLNNSTKDGEILQTLAFFKLLLFVNAHAVKKADTPTDFIAKAVDYINANIAEDLTLESVALAVHISKYHFLRRFKAVLGVTVMDYVLKTRLAMAKQLLLTGKYSVSEVSDKCGFSSVSYFSSVFKKTFKLTANEFKKGKTV